ncbi:MAG: MobF family relaxase [Pirellulaceae bacterium]
MLRNEPPKGSGHITGNQKHDRRAVYDFTFSVPKSVSLLSMIAGDERIETVFRESVLATMKHIEEDAKVRVRVKRENGDRVSGNLVYADFLHHYARPVGGLVDPQLHLHVAVLNMSFDAVENKWKALQAGGLKADAPYYQAVFRQELAARLQALGYELNVSKGDFEVVGVPCQAVSEFSKRTEVIKARAAELGIKSETSRAKLGATTRESKPAKFDRNELWHQWRNRLSDRNYAAIDETHRSSFRRRVTMPPENDKYVDLAMSHLTERKSVVTERSVVRDALSRGLGRVSLVGIRQEMKRRIDRGEYLTQTQGGVTYVTTRDIMLEETELVKRWKGGRGKRHRIGRKAFKPTDEKLSRAQANVVRHILDSYDEIISVRGVAGTGKTRTMVSAKAAIEGSGLSVVALAPTGDASRNTMRAEGMLDADTIHTFLHNGSLQKKARGGVIFVDEASLAGAREMLALTKRANELDARLVLWGDRRQHKSVPRGDTLALLEDFAGIKSVELCEIRRQKGKYKRAVELLSQGQSARAFDMLDEMGWIREAGHEQLAADYVSLKKSGKSVTVIAPTHVEGDSVTEHIRRRLKEAGEIGPSQQISILRDLQFTETQKTTELSPGHVVQFNRHSGKYRIGQRVEVDHRNLRELRGRVSAFTAYQTDTIELAAGDKIRATRGGNTTDRMHRLENGSIYTIEWIKDDGRIRLTTGGEIARDFGHICHGYVTTSIAAQGRTSDHVLVAQSADSYAASNQRQLYVSISRGRHHATIYTDDKAHLRICVQKADPALMVHNIKPSPGHIVGIRLSKIARRLMTWKYLADLTMALQTREGRRNAVFSR